MTGMSHVSWLSVLGVLVALTGLTAPKTVAQSTAPTINQIPHELKVPDDQILLVKLAAKGTQIYVCKATLEQPNQLNWTFKAPQADLFKDFKDKTKIGRHYAGPTWEANDGSKIIGQVKAKVQAPQPDAIPWLLLTTTSQGGSGWLARVNWVQRLNTVGGQAPTKGCDRRHQNQETAVGYSADYYFYGTNTTSYEY